MQENDKAKSKKRRKKRSRFGYYLYAFFAFILAIANITLTLLLLTYVQEIQVTGVEHVSEQQVLEWAEEERFNVNSVYAILKYQAGYYDVPAYANNIELHMKAPWKLEAKVDEKPIVGCVFYDNAYIYFAEDGTVLLKETERLDDIPVIEGVSVVSATLYEPMKLEDKKTLSYLQEASEEILKNDLHPERIVWEDDGVNLYFGEVVVKLGKMNFDEKIIELPPIMEKLEGQKGILHMEHYSEMSSHISFEKE